MEGLGFDPGMEAASLPPRKRLLAGLKKKQNGWGVHSSASSSSSSSAASTVVNSPTLGSENPNPNLKPSIETLKAAALAAAEAAATAKRIAVEKASAAMKAAAAAKSALELAASAAAGEKMESREGFCVKPTKHVPIKLLYKGKSGERVEKKWFKNSSGGGCSPVKKHEPIKLSYKGKRIETKGAKEKPLMVPNLVNDEELARELHRVMNSSPRISRNLDRQNHVEKPASSACCLPSPSKVNRLRVVSSVYDVISDGKDGDCAYSKVVASNDNKWSLPVEVASSNKLAESVSEAMDEENHESKEVKSEISIMDEENRDLKEHKLEVHIMDEETSCLFQSNGNATKQHSFDIVQAISESKVGLKRKKRSLDSWQIEESYKCARVQSQAENHQENHLVEETKSSLLANESTFRSHPKKSNMRRNSERRMRSISGDFPQVSKLSVDAVPTWCR